MRPHTDSRPPTTTRLRPCTCISWIFLPRIRGFRSSWFNTTTTTEDREMSASPTLPLLPLLLLLHPPPPPPTPTFPYATVIGLFRWWIFFFFFLGRLPNRLSSTLSTDFRFISPATIQFWNRANVPRSILPLASFRFEIIIFALFYSTRREKGFEGSCRFVVAKSRWERRTIVDDVEWSINHLERWCHGGSRNGFVLPFSSFWTFPIPLDPYRWGLMRVYKYRSKLR